MLVSREMVLHGSTSYAFLITYYTIKLQSPLETHLASTPVYCRLAFVYNNGILGL